MATKSENADIAVLQEQMEGVKSDVTDVKADVKTILGRLDDSYVKKDEFRAFKWTTIPLTILVTVVLTFLVTFFFQKITEPTSNNPTSSSTTTTTTPTGSTSETKTSDISQTTPTTSSAPPDPSTSGGVQLELPKLLP